MCGFAGFIECNNNFSIDASRIVKRMTNSLSHRGPDDVGVWLDNSGVAFGHRRLSINDLSIAGHQPMVSYTGRYVLIFNGEIYNHNSLRKLLAEQNWRGQSDTETLLACIERWGLKKTLEASVGMFALAVWDKSERSLSLARDRMGEKPLYYGWHGNFFLFGSELKSLKIHPSFISAIDRQALCRYVRSGNVPAPYTIYSGTSKLPPGTIATLLNVDILKRQVPEITPFWSLEWVIEKKLKNPFIGNEQDAVAHLDELLTQSITGQQLADVPIGAFLSGGVDSSTVVALMQANSLKPVKTFSIGFNEQDYDESGHARVVAAHLRTDHTEFRVTSSDVLNVIPELATIYDEPFADASQLPTLLVSRLARQQVSVAMTGDGGDELFCGYGRYTETAARWFYLQLVPTFARNIARWVLPESPLRDALALTSIDEFYDFINRQWKASPRLVYRTRSLDISTVIPLVLASAKERMMYADAINYLPNDILVKVDRAAMSCGLETRVPLLDHRIVEFAWSLPSSIKNHEGIGKWPLKQLLYRYVPKNLVDRPKKGFAVPIEKWLRGDLRDWAEDLLDESKLIQQGYFDPKPIREEWRTHLSGRKDRHYGLWTILMFQDWLNSTSK